MVGEALAAVLLGVAGLWLLLQPLIRPRPARPLPLEPVEPEETPRGLALAALKEIEFDRETGKLSDADYDSLKAKYTAAALESLRREQAEAVSDGVEALIADKVRALRFASAATPSNVPPQSSGPGGVCGTCGPRSEPDALFCSSCGRHLPVLTLCSRCGAILPPEGRFCETCGEPVAA